MKSYTTKDYDTGALNILRIEKLMIISALKKTEWNKTLASKKLGITQPTLNIKIKKHNIKKIN
jgi:transcriptional regulator of acetoin/glycerol metabolism